MRDDVIEQLGDNCTVTVRVLTQGVMDPSTGKVSVTQTDSAFAAIRGPDEINWVSGSARRTRVYTIALANPETVNWQSARLLDGAEEMEIIEFRALAGRRLVQILAGKAV